MSSFHSIQDSISGTGKMGCSAQVALFSLGLVTFLVGFLCTLIYVL